MDGQSDISERLLASNWAMELAVVQRLEILKIFRVILIAIERGELYINAKD